MIGKQEILREDAEFAESVCCK